MQLTLNIPNPLAARASLFVDHDQPFTTSRAVAKRFGKNHKDVLRTIEKTLADSPDPEFNRRNFAPVTYLDAKGESRPEYRLTHDGFALIAMRFTGTEALAWQIAFLSAFNALEAELKIRVEREAAALYRLRPHWRAIGVGLSAGLKRSQICTLTGHRSPDTISANKRRMREAGLLAA